MTDTIQPPIPSPPPPLLVNGTEHRNHPVFPLQHVITPFLPTAVSQDDDGQISCFCGINEDDGNTVACDLCNRWQHISCYYPQHADGSLPDDLQHFCVDCKPRPVDVAGAQIRQQNRVHILQNGAKRSTSKKKRVKDLPAVSNGWPLDKSRHERTSASPREQGPPTKRPKTTHRKRSASSLHHRSASFSPDLASLTYSPEFIQAYRHDDFTIPDANCFSSLAIGSKLSQWLSEPAEFFRVTGKEQHDIFSRWDGDISTIDFQHDLIDIQAATDQRVTLDDGSPVTWKYATIKEPLTNQAFIGELKGTVGLKEDYEADPANRWSVVRHPEPFVFYYAHLPIYIDARQEGTIVRYIRRSCNPNAELKIIITGNDYHFCFIALRDIEAGEEIAIAWDCARTIADMISARTTDAVSRNDLESLQQWITTVLSECGPCACNRAECLMARFDKRFSSADDERPTKPKAGRKKKSQQISPTDTMALNSRSGSEARKLDPEDDRLDTRSSSGSAEKGSMSRDITPNTHYSTNGSNTILPELSERERKKLAKEEEMFRRQEEEAVGKQIKKKRISGGPSVKSGSRSTEPSNKRSGKRTKSTTEKLGDIRRTKPVYVEASTQCNLDAEEAAVKAQARQESHSQRRRHQPFHHGILQRCAVANAMWRRNAGRKKSATSHDADEDTAMTDADPTTISTSSQINTNGDIQMTEATSNKSTEQTIEPPAPPWNDRNIPSTNAVEDKSQQNQAEEMKLEMPPPVTNPFTLPAQPLSATTPTGGNNGAVTQSPSAAVPASLLSPSIQSIVTPARKKLSLSDYTRRSKAKETDPKMERESSPSSIASGPVATQSEQKMSKEGMLPDDAHMDEHALATSADVQMMAGVN